MLGIIGAMDTEVAKLKELMTEVDVKRPGSGCRARRDW